MYGYRQTSSTDIQSVAAEIGIHVDELVEIVTEWSSESPQWDRFIYSNTGEIVPQGTEIGVEIDGDNAITWLYDGIELDLDVVWGVA